MPARHHRALTGAQAAMHPGLFTRTTALGLAALVVVSALGYWGVSAYRKSQLQKAGTALVKDSSERLQGALAGETGTAPEGGAQTGVKPDDHARKAEKNVAGVLG